MKISLVLGAVLICAASAQAQHACAHGGTTSNAGNGVSWSLGGQIGGATINSGQQSEHHLAPHPLTLSYGKNDGEYVPTTYMNYDEALALGRQQLADAAEATLSARVTQPFANIPLGDVARLLRSAKLATLEARALRTDSLKLQSPAKSQQSN